jgi:Zn-finger nucleic acid-binding protein
MSRICPKCEIELIEELQGDMTLDVCLQCAGIWFDNDELNNIREQDPAVLMQIDQQFRPKTEPATSGGIRNCPACRLPMRRYNYLYTSPIELDECEQCGGVWVDDGELEKMVIVLNEAKTQSIPPEIKDDLAIAQWQAEHQDQVARASIFKRFFRFLGGRLYF